MASKHKPTPKRLNISIHPRGPGGDKSNTCAPRRKAVVTAAHQSHLEQHPTDGMSAARAAKIRAAA